MKKIKFSCCCLSILIFGMVACKKEQKSLVNEILELDYQESIQVPFIDRSVLLDTINDTRCPADVLCTHAGWVTVDLSLKPILFSNAPTETIKLDLYNKDTLGRLIFSLLEVSPYPLYQNPIPIEDKQIKVQIESF